jgi:uncharacterized protein (DUF58 family)
VRGRHPAPYRPPRLGQLAPEQALRRLDLTINRRLDGLLQGDYQGLIPGPGSDPAEARLYAVGDDVRRIDWNVTARTTQPHVRDLIADRELETWLLVDLSPSMEFGTALYEKRDLAIAAAATVGFLAARGGNRIGCRALLPDGTRLVPARPGRQHLLSLLRMLLGTRRPIPPSTNRRTDRSPPPTPMELAQAVAGLATTQRRRGLSVVISDFLGIEAGTPTWEAPMRRLAARHQVLAIEIIDPRELTLPDVGILTLVDPETGRRREVRTSRSVRDRYAAGALAQRRATRDALRRAGAGHLRLSTDADWVRDVARYVLQHRRLAYQQPGLGRRLTAAAHEAPR